MILPHTHPLWHFAHDQLEERQADVLRPFQRVMDWQQLTPDSAPDLVTACLTLTPPDLHAKLAALHAVLDKGGLFLGATFGGQTLQELRACLMEAECESTGGAALRLAPLPQAEELTRMMAAIGFESPVIDVETVVVRYPDLRALLRDVRLFRSTRPLPLHTATRALWRKTEELYIERHANTNGGLSATVEIVFLHGWKK